MKYEIHMFLRRLYMQVTGKNCETCIYYDGRFGEDCCFKCEHSIGAVEYKRRKA